MSVTTQQPQVVADRSISTEERADAKRDYPWPWTGYSKKPEEMPLSGYTAILGAYVGIFGPLFSLVGSRRNTERASITDVLLFGIATHKIGRIITKDWVTAPLRAPFTEYVKSAGGGEVDERSRGEGVQRAIGDLLTCPWCIAPWVASGLYSMFLINPRAARLLAAGATSVAASDFLQHVFASTKRLSE